MDTYIGEIRLFALPDLRARIPVHRDGATLLLGQSGGAEQVTLSAENVPPHTHPLQATLSPADVVEPVAGAALAATAVNTHWSESASGPDTELSSNSIAPNESASLPVPTVAPVPRHQRHHLHVRRHSAARLRDRR